MNGCAKLTRFCFLPCAKHVAEILPSKETGEDREEVHGHVIHIASGCHDHNKFLHLWCAKQHGVKAVDNYL